MISFLFFVLDYFLMLADGWFLMHALGYLIRIKESPLQRFVLLLSCTVLGSMVIFLGDAFNILATVPFFWIAVCFSCESGLWQKTVIAAMYASTVFSFNALRDNFLDSPIFDHLSASQESHIIVSDILFIRQNHCLSMIISIFFALILYFGIRRYAPDKDYALSDSLWKLLFLLTATPLGVVLSLTALFDFESPHSVVLAGYPAECFVLLVIALFSFISLLRCITVLAKQQTLEQQSMLAEINRKYYESMEQQHFEIRRLKHDLANHLQTLGALPKEQRDSYLADLAANDAVSETLSYCGDTTINAVLTVKKNRMDRYGIRLESAIDIPLALPFHGTDICALYANALDNAIEACRRTEESKRQIVLRSKAQKGLFCLGIQNPVPETSTSILSHVSRDGTIPTTKTDKANHGVGLQSIREIVKRYGGLLEIKTENGMFDLFLYIPMPSEKTS